MTRILNITAKDLQQLFRDRKTFLFLLIMPIGFTLLFGYAFGGFSKSETDSRLPVALVNQDGEKLSEELAGILANSEVIRLVSEPEDSLTDFEDQLADNKLAGIIVIPSGYSQSMQANSTQGKELPRLLLQVDNTTSGGISIQNEVLTAARRLAQACWTAQTARQTNRAIDFETALDQSLLAWQKPPIAIEVTAGTAAEATTNEQSGISLAHSSPGMMLQFAIAGLLTAAQVMVNERKSRCLQRLLTTATRRVDILLGHYLAIFVLIFAQFLALIVFGQWILKIDYLRLPVATLLVAVAAALCIASLGLLIGAWAKNEEQAITFSLIIMFVFSGLGGAWMPLELTGKTFQAIGHLTPVAWAMDGFKNIIARGLGLESTLLPVIVLAGYAVVFFMISTWKFYLSEGR